MWLLTLSDNSHYAEALPAAFAAQPFTNPRVGYDFAAGERGDLGRGPTLFEVPLEIQVDFSDPFAAKGSDPVSFNCHLR